MPVSSPSYFPPSRGTDQIVGITAGRSQTGARVFLAGQGAGDNSSISDLILIGNNAGAAGLNNANQVGTSVVGQQSLKVFTGATGPSVGLNGPITILGYSNLTQIVNRVGASVILGTEIYENLPAAGGEVSSSVVIGAQAAQNHQILNANSHACANMVIIGHRAARGTAITTAGGGAALQTSVIIGAEAASSTGADTAVPGGGISQCVIIGYQAGISVGAGQNNTGQLNTLLGYQCGGVLQGGDNNTLIGASITTTAAASENVAVGSGMTGIAGDGNTLLGHGIVPAGLATNRNIILGIRAAQGYSGVYSDLFIVETNTAIGGTKRTILFGDMALGNLILGNSTQGANRDTGGTNTVKLLNGSVGVPAPVGGGYFYVTAGALHWVGSAGTDTVIAPA